jgi:large subunit ribosomal protein L17
MRRNMAMSLIQHGAIRTTEPKAKDLRRFVERLITAARKGTLHARRQVIAQLTDREMTGDEGDFLDQTVVQKLFDEIVPRYVNRPGGYTRIIRLNERRLGDAGSQVILQLIEEESPASAKTGGSGRRSRRATKRYQAAGAAGKARSGKSATATAEQEPDRAEGDEPQPESSEPDQPEQQQDEGQGGDAGQTGDQAPEGEEGKEKE